MITRRTVLQGLAASIAALPVVAKVMIVGPIRVPVALNLAHVQRVPIDNVLPRQHFAA